MTLYKNREKFNKFSEKIGYIFSTIGLTPNQWTFLSIIIALIGVWFIVNYNFFWGAIFVLISIFLDIVDGSVARATKQVSKIGGYLDTIVDRYVEAFIIGGLVLINLPDFIIDFRFWLFAYFFGSLMTTYVKAAAVEKNLKKSEIRGGLVERADRMILLIIGLFLAVLSPVYLVYMVVLLAFLSNITTLQRIKIAFS